MRSDIIQIDNQENGYREAEEQTLKTAAFRDLGRKETMHLQLLAEEMLSMIHSVTGSLQASFWLESVGKTFELHLTTNIIMDKEIRQQLISTASSKKNEASRSFLGRLRNAFEQALTSDTERTYFDLPEEIQADLTGRDIEDPEWDGYERSVLRRMANDVSVFIRGKEVHLTVTKTFL